MTLTCKVLLFYFLEKVELSELNAFADNNLSHNKPCFQYNIAITNFLVLHTCEIRLNDVISQSNVHMYSYAKVPKHG